MSRLSSFFHAHCFQFLWSVSDSFGPTSPFAPRDPGLPDNPFSPFSPRGPAGPTTPLSPLAPSRPLGPGSPFCPFIPLWQLRHRPHVNLKKEKKKGRKKKYLIFVTTCSARPSTEIYYDVQNDFILTTVVILKDFKISCLYYKMQASMRACVCVDVLISNTLYIVVYLLFYLHTI